MAGYSETPLLKKLGIKSGMSIYISAPPVSYFDDLGGLPPGVKLSTKLVKELDFIHFFVTDQKAFKKLFIEAAKSLKQNGMIWVSWPKKISKVQTDLDENVIRDFGLKAGLVDVKVCAVDLIWSGLKFVIRVANRK